MANAIPQEIKKDLQCYICSGELKDPVDLPCLHAFCFECLHTWHQASQDKKQVICPNCKEAATVPREGIHGLPVHSSTKDLKMEQLYKHTSTQPTVPDYTPCHVCRKKSDVHCLDCNKSICNQCQASHNAFMQDHKIVTIEDFTSGQVTTEGRFCTIHDNVLVRYYCETEEKQVCVDCVSLNTCPTEHKRITLKEAAKKHTTLIEELQKKCADNMEKFQVAVQECNLVLDDLSDSVKQTETELEKCKQKYVEQVEKEFDALIQEMKKIQTNRVKDVERNKVAIESEVREMEKVSNQASNLTKSGLEHLITHKFSCLQEELNKLSVANPKIPSKSLCYLKYEHTEHTLPLMGSLSQNERWKLTSSFSTGNLKNPLGIAVNHDGDIIVTSYDKGVKVFSRNGHEKCTFVENQTKLMSVSVLHDNRCIIANGSGREGIQFHTSEGKYLSNIPVCNINDQKRNINSVAVNQKDQIIVGLTNTISIHYADGSLLSNFHTTSTSNCLAATPENDIVCCFRNPEIVQLLNHSGSIIRTVYPPEVIQKWSPTYLCCGKRKIFIVNGPNGDPTGIFSFTSTGEYLGCITTEVESPRCIALSSDETQLFVVERDTFWSGEVKIFHKE